jgi:cytochrome c553
MRYLAAAFALFLTACGGDPLPGHTVQQVAGANTPIGQLFETQCAACHAADGAGMASAKAPAIANLPAWYTKRQLEHFQRGIRGAHPDDDQGAIMAASAAALDATQIGDLANYVAALPATSPAITIKGEPARGKDHYSNICSACHGSDARGNEALGAPTLVGVDDWYLLGQYEKFRDGIRGSHADDSWGAQMVRIAPVLENDDTVQDVVAWLATQPVED